MKTTLYCRYRLRADADGRRGRSRMPVTALEQAGACRCPQVYHRGAPAPRGASRSTRGVY